jgi:hypothetical protein
VGVLGPGNLDCAGSAARRPRATGMRPEQPRPAGLGAWLAGCLLEGDWGCAGASHTWRDAVRALPCRRELWPGGCRKPPRHGAARRRFVGPGQT